MTEITVSVSAPYLNPYPNGLLDGLCVKFEVTIGTERANDAASSDTFSVKRWPNAHDLSALIARWMMDYPE